jgi:hypothetical protein
MLFGVVLDMWDYFFIMLIVSLALSSLTVYLKPKDRLRLKRIEAKLDQLLKHSGVTYDPFADVPLNVQEAIRHGDLNLAAKYYRDAAGVTFTEAFEYVNDLKKLSENVKADK